MIPADKIDKACEAVYERITGKCWHVWGGHAQRFRTINFSKCGKCGVDYDNNPPLATSLDKWAEHIWPVMTEEQKYEHYRKLAGLDNMEGLWVYEATAMHHLEAAINWLKVEL